jgi:DUF4097 and DUF4098 domain-containing protein YvlB
MKRFNMIYLPILLVFLLLKISPAVDAKNLQRSFEVKAGGLLILDTDVGSVKIFSWDQPKVDVQVFREFRGWDEDRISDFLENFPIEFSQQNSTIEITGHLKKGWKMTWKNFSVSYEIRVPDKFNLDLRTSGGSISVDDLEGKVEAKTSGGSLNFGNINGSVLANTSGGSISLKGCTADVSLRTSGGSITTGKVGGKTDAHTSGGSIHITQSLGDVVAQTSGGSITIEEAMGSIDANTSGGSVNIAILKQPKEDCRLETSGGTVNVSLAKDIAMNIDARTHSGRVKSEIPISATGKKKEDWVIGTINGGGPELYLRTSGGNIYINER